MEEREKKNRHDCDEGDRPCLEIAGKVYTQDQVSSIAFNAFYYSGRNVEAGYLTWQRIVQDPDLTTKDYAFLLLYFLEKFGTDEIKEIFKDDVPRIKRYVD